MAEAKESRADSPESLADKMSLIEEAEAEAARGGEEAAEKRQQAHQN